MKRLVSLRLLSSIAVIAVLSGCATSLDAAAPTPEATTSSQFVIYSDNWTTTTPFNNVPTAYTMLIEAFGTIAADGTAGNPAPPPTTGKPAGQKWLLSFGGANANFGMFEGQSGPNQTAIDTFTNTAASIVNSSFDGVDLDVEDLTYPGKPGSDISPKSVIAIIQGIKSKLQPGKLLTASPQASYVYPGVAVGAGWNNYVPIINAVGNDIDFINLQGYNNWPDSSPADYVTTYTNWVEPFNQAGVSYNGFPAKKLLMGLLASPSAGSNGYLAPNDVNTAISTLRVKYPDFGGTMMWDNDWDAQANRTITNGIQACVLQDICGS